MKHSDCLEFVIIGAVCAMVHFLLGGSAHEACTDGFRLIGICTILRAACDLIEQLRR
jgi:hypothetical protein